MTETKLTEQMKSDAALGCWYLVGATCSGKTRTGIALAERIGAEIVSLDSMAIYRGMDLGTAKPTAEDCARIPHHLIDIRDPNENFSLSQYIDAVFDVIRDIRSRGKRVLVVGGTPLYLKSMLRGLFTGPEADWEFRKAIEEELEQLDIAELRNRLEQVDPVSAHKLHPNDKRRMIRALEVYRVTGEPLSHQQTHFDEGTPAEECNVFTLRWPRAKLHERIGKRVDDMFTAGFEDEVRGLLKNYGELSRTAMQAVGYAEVISLLESQTSDANIDAPNSNNADSPNPNNSESTNPDAHADGANSDAHRQQLIERVRTRTRRFARRQETWFRAMSECRWLEVDDDTNWEDVVKQIEQEGLANETVARLERNPI